MGTFPQHGGCLCGDLRYTVAADPVTLYACHCTDCQRETGSGFALLMVVGRDAFQLDAGQPAAFTTELADGRTKGAFYCGRCVTTLYGQSPESPFVVLEAGTLDDTSWLRPAGHIWTRSAQPWVRFDDDALRFAEAPGDEGLVALARAWKSRPGRE